MNSNTSTIERGFEAAPIDPDLAARQQRLAVDEAAVRTLWNSVARNFPEAFTPRPEVAPEALGAAVVDSATTPKAPSNPVGFNGGLSVTDARQQVNDAKPLSRDMYA